MKEPQGSGYLQKVTELTLNKDILNKRNTRIEKVGMLIGTTAYHVLYTGAALRDFAVE